MNRVRSILTIAAAAVLVSPLAAHAAMIDIATFSWEVSVLCDPATTDPRDPTADPNCFLTNFGLLNTWSGGPDLSDNVLTLDGDPNQQTLWLSPIGFGSFEQIPFAGQAQPQTARADIFFSFFGPQTLFGTLSVGDLTQDTNDPSFYSAVLNFQFDDTPPTPIPEPSTFLLLGAGLLAARRRWIRRR